MFQRVIHMRRGGGSLALAALALGLGACTGSGGDNLHTGGGNSTGGCGEVTGSGPGAGSASAHAEASRSEAEVKVTQENGKFTASRVITLSNDFGGASQGNVTLDTGNGNVSTCRRDGGYVFKVYAYARGASEQEARDNLERVSVSHSDTLAAGTLTLSTSAVLTTVDDPGLPVPLPGTGTNTDNVEWGASMLAGLPSTASYAFDLGTSNGVIEATGFAGSSATLDSSNGEVVLDGRWDDASLGTSNGYVVVDGDFGGLDASTTNGGIVADLDSARSADVTLDTTNGEIDVQLRRSGAAGYDLSADATNGEARISVGGTQPVGTQTDESKHYQTPDYASRAVQISVQADTSNGVVSIRD